MKHHRLLLAILLGCAMLSGCTNNRHARKARSNWEGRSYYRSPAIDQHDEHCPRD